MPTSSVMSIVVSGQLSHIVSGIRAGFRSRQERCGEQGWGRAERRKAARQRKERQKKAR